MTVLVNSFDGGTSGTSVTAGNSGGLSGNPFDTVAIGTNATLAYDSTLAAHGTLSVKVATGVTSTTSLMEWSTSLGSNATVWFRAYLYYTANPASVSAPVRVQAGGTHAADVAVNSSGNLVFRNTGFTPVGTFTNSIPLNQWFRIEGYFTGDPSAGVISCSLYDSQDSRTATETETATSVDTAGTLTQAWFGESASGSGEGPWWIDDIGVSTTGYLGPFGYVYTGYQTLYYLDYLDVMTGQTLVAVPGNSYLMQVIERPGLSIPPADNRWVAA